MSKSNGILAALGRNVRRQRDARQLTQEKVAEKSGLDPTYISDIERGLRNPGITFHIIHETLTEHLKHHVHHRVIDAQSVVPQHRERIFLVGLIARFCGELLSVKFEKGRIRL